MEVSLAVLSDFANVSNDGRLNILGIFTSINSHQSPFQLPNMALVMKLKASPGEKGTQQRIKVVIVDQDGKIVSPPAEMTITIPDLPGADIEMNAILGMTGIVFQKFGLHRVDVTVNDHNLVLLPFNINAVAPPPGQPPVSMPPPV